ANGGLRSRDDERADTTAGGGRSLDQAVPLLSSAVADIRTPGGEHRRARLDRRRGPRPRALPRTGAARVRLRPQARAVGSPLGSGDELARVPHPLARARLLAGGPLCASWSA